MRRAPSTSHNTDSGFWSPVDSTGVRKPDRDAQTASRDPDRDAQTAPRNDIRDTQNVLCDSWYPT